MVGIIHTFKLDSKMWSELTAQAFYFTLTNPLTFIVVFSSSMSLSTFFIQSNNTYEYFKGKQDADSNGLSTFRLNSTVALKINIFDFFLCNSCEPNIWIME